MSTFWLKIAGFAVVIVGVIILIGYFSGSETKTSPASESKPKTYWEQVEQDREKFLSEPESVEDAQKQEAMLEQNHVARKAVQPAKEQTQPTERITLYFKELSEIDKIEAERLLNVAVPGRSIGRLQTGFKLMVDSCRQIIERWPDSWYAYRAKQMLADMPPRYQERYDVTEEELDLSKFAEPRPGTKPFIVEGPR